MKKKLGLAACAAAGVLAGCLNLGTHTETMCDIVIYGSSPAAIAAAVQAKRMGKSAVIVSPETRIGGLTTGGLGQTDIGNKSAFGGIALEFYKAVAEYYADTKRWPSFLFLLLLLFLGGFLGGLLLRALRYLRSG